MTYRFSAPLWKWKGDSAWHFVTLPFEESDEIDERSAHVQHGFGSVKVHVTVGGTSWSTSVFPSTTERAYILPVKASVRKAERLTEGALVDVAIDLSEV